MRAAMKKLPPETDSLWIHRTTGSVVRVYGMEDHIVLYRFSDRSSTVWRLSLEEFADRFRPQ